MVAPRLATSLRCKLRLRSVIRALSPKKPSRVQAGVDIEEIQSQERALTRETNLGVLQ